MYKTNINLNLYKTFYDVAKYGSISKAAQYGFTSQPAISKSIKKLEDEGIIRGYNTCIYREDEITMFIDIVTVPGQFEAVLKYVSTQTAYIRQIYRTTKENHIHMVAVSDSAGNLAYLTKKIRKQCGGNIVEIECHAVKEVIKDVYGGIRYEDRAASESERNHEQY